MSFLMSVFLPPSGEEEEGAGAAGAAAAAEEATTGVAAAAEGGRLLQLFSATTLSRSSARAPISFWNPTRPITSIDSRRSRSSTLNARSGPYPSRI